MATIDRRLQLHEILCDILGSRNAYFQPPESEKMEYPAIVYAFGKIENTYADNGVYLSCREYSVTVIDKDPDSPLVGMVATLPECHHKRHYEKNNLNHDVFRLFY